MECIGDNETDFEILFEGVRKVGEVGANETSFDITNLEAGHTYAYIVRAIGADSTLSTTAHVSFVTEGTSSAGRYAQYYTFTLAEATTVVIDLESSTADAFVYLLSGNGKDGSRVAYDDDGGGTYRNSRITKRLEAGTYTIEATTYSSAKTGSFSVKLGHIDTVRSNHHQSHISKPNTKWSMVIINHLNT